MNMVRSAPLGRLLIDTGVLTQVKLDEALVIQRSDRRRLGEILVDRGLVQPRQLAQLLSHQLSCPWISLVGLEIAPDVLSLVSEDLALEHGLIPVHRRVSGGRAMLYVATDDPTDEDALAACAAHAGLPVRPLVAITSDIRAALARYYDGPPVSEVPSPSEIDPKSAAFPPPTPTPTRTPTTTMLAVTVMPAEARNPDHEVENVEAKEPEKRAPTVLVLNAPSGFLAQCKEAVAAVDARLIDGGISRAGELVLEHRPCAIVVTDDVYAFDRSGLNRLALDNDAHLVVWSEEVDGRQLEPLLSGAIDRWGRSSYEKGAVIDGRYELLRDLGDPSSRGNGSRWEVRHVRTARRSVLALAVRGDEGDENAIAIRREQRALARVSHPGAVELRDAGTTELGDPYIVLEPLEGRTLDGLVAARMKLIPGDVCAVIMQVAEVLGAAHAAGVLHRHVATENVLVVRDGYGIERAKLTGWGRAKVGDQASLDCGEDLAALGVCAFEALTGRRHRPGENVAAAGVSASVAPLLTRLLARGFGSAKEVVAVLAEAAHKERPSTSLLDASPRSRDGLSGKQATTPAEQRRFARAAYRTPIRIELSGVGAIEGRTEDISSGGLLVVAKGGVKPGAEVTVRFALPLDGRVVAEPATIKWSRAARFDDSSGLCAIGVQLTGPAPDTLRQIDRYVALLSDG
jgi:hypothetical protein